MGDERPAVDQYGNRGTFRRSGGDWGCLMPLIVIAAIIAIPVIIILFIVGGIISVGQNLGIIKVAPTPIHIEQSATSAERSGKTAYCQVPNCNLSGNISDPPVIELFGGGALTFTVQIPRADTYYLCIDVYDESHLSAGTIDVFVGNNLSYKIDPQNGQFIGLGSNSPNSCVNDNPIQLNSGTNSIKIQLEEVAQCSNGSTCDPPYIHIKDIALDPKSN